MFNLRRHEGLTRGRYANSCQPHTNRVLENFGTGPAAPVHFLNDANSRGTVSPVAQIDPGIWAEQHWITVKHTRKPPCHNMPILMIPNVNLCHRSGTPWYTNKHQYLSMRDQVWTKSRHLTRAFRPLAMAFREKLSRQTFELNQPQLLQAKHSEAYTCSCSSQPMASELRKN